jgi:tetratricopeptide (TPR) repeat protein
LAEGSLYLRDYLKDRRLTSKDFHSLIQYHTRHNSAAGVYEGLLKAWLDHYPQEPEARWAWVEWYDRKGEKERAEQILAGLLAESPNEVKYVEKAADLAYQTYIRQRSFLTPLSYEPALSLYKRGLVLSREGQDRIHQKIAAVYREAGLYGEALSAVLKAISVHHNGGKTTVPEDDLLLEAGLLAAELDNRDRAAFYLKKALSVNPDNRAARRALETLITAARR